VGGYHAVPMSLREALVGVQQALVALGAVVTVPAHHLSDDDPLLPGLVDYERRRLRILLSDQHAPGPARLERPGALEALVALLRQAAEEAGMLRPD
jgi:hypothetical protein